MVTSRERSNDKTPVGLKTDSVISTRSSSRGGDTRTSTTSSLTAAKFDVPLTVLSTTACRNCDWRTFKQSIKGLWRSAHGSALKRS